MYRTSSRTIKHIHYDTYRDMYLYLLHRMNTEKPVGQVCKDNNFVYYNLFINGHLVMYAKNRWRPDGKRMFVFSDELARLFGFMCLDDMRYWLPKMQYYNKMATTEAFKRNFAKYRISLSFKDNN